MFVLERGRESLRRVEGCIHIFLILQSRITDTSNPSKFGTTISGILCLVMIDKSTFGAKNYLCK